MLLIGDIFTTELYTTIFLPELLGAMDHICAECAMNALSGQRYTGPTPENILVNL